MHSVKKNKATQEQINAKKQTDARKIKEYRSLIGQCVNARNNRQYSKESLQYTTKLLEWNPEDYTRWNFRREILASLFSQDPNLKAQLLTADLRLIETILPRHPKVYWIWNHRQWCLENTSQSDWTHELGLVTKLLELDARNFHGWTYRRYVIRNMEKTSGQTMTEQEFEYTTRKINSNFSNFSAWHNRAKLIPLLLQERGLDNEARRSFLIKELDYIRQAIYTDPDDQSAWIYHRWLVTDEQIADMTQEQKQAILTSEIESIQELYDEEPDSKWCALSLLFLRKLNNQDDENHRFKELESLKKNDPLRKNRYEYLKKHSTSL